VLEVRPNDAGTLTVVNVVNLEDYLRGVVPNELSPLSFPDIELLIVVRRPDVQLFDYLQRRLEGVRGVKVILERRIGDRRRDARQRAPDRRRLRRRLRLGQASSLGYTVVRFRPR